MKTRRPLFVSFEGGEGAGKTTQIRLLAERLRALGWSVTETREPGGGALGMPIRSLLLDAKTRGLDPMAELLLIEAQRAQHVRDVIAPALAAGHVVLTDRYVDSTAAYQGGGRRLDAKLVRTLNRLATGGVTPDLTLLLDVPVERGLTRARARTARTEGEREGRFEAEALAFHHRVRREFHRLARSEPRRFRVVRADRSIDEVASEVAAIVEPRVIRAQRRSAPRRSS